MVSHIPKSLKEKAKKHGLRITVTRNGHRVPKSKQMLEKQLHKKTCKQSTRKSTRKSTRNSTRSSGFISSGFSRYHRSPGSWNGKVDEEFFSLWG